MAIFKCKMCGGDLEIAEGASIAECQYCGSKQTLPRFDSERKANLYDRANHFRRNNEFDKAEGIYEQILNEDPTDAEAYWSLVLCRYGIEYVEDPATHKRVPTVNRAQYTSVFADENYKKAVEYADILQKSVYEDEAKAIDAIQKGILEISEREDPFDVFICYKETDAQGRRTPDSVLANELYHELTNEGFKVFFSRITLEDKLGTAYEPYIFAALHSAKVMVVLGTRPEYFNAVWVKNEWSRYLALIRAGEKKTLIPAYRDMDPYDLPEEFSHLQAQDMSKLGFMPDLIRGVKKLLEADKPKEAAPVQPVVQQTVVQSAGGANLTAQIKRGQQALEDGDWSAADGFFDKALDIDAECAEAFFGKALAVAKCSNGETLVRTRLMNPATEKEMLTACERDSQHIGELVKQYSVPGYFGEDRANELFAYDKRTFQSLTRAWNERIRQENTYWNQDRQLSRAVRYAKGELAETLKSLRERVDAALQKSLSESEAADTNAKAEVLERYLNAMEQAEEKAKQLYDEAVKRRQADYESVCEAQKAAVTDEDFDKVASRFETVGLKDYEDCKARARQCRDEAVRQREEARKKAAEEAKRKRIEREKAEATEKAKKKKIGIIIASIVVVVIAAVLIVTQIIIPGNKYKQAEALLAAGDYDGAAAAFEALRGYKDSAERSLRTHYESATAMLKNGEYEEAATAFLALNDYSDSIEQAKINVPWRAAQRLAEAANQNDAGLLSVYKQLPTVLRKLYNENGKKDDSAVSVPATSQKSSAEKALTLEETLKERIDSDDVIATYNLAEDLLQLIDTTTIESPKLDGKQIESFLVDTIYHGKMRRKEELRTALINETYATAEAMAAAGEYEKAKASFEWMERYLDASERANELSVLCMIDTVEARLRASDYSVSLNALQELYGKEMYGYEKQIDQLAYSLVKTALDAKDIDTANAALSLIRDQDIVDAEFRKNLSTATAEKEIETAYQFVLDTKRAYTPEQIQALEDAFAAIPTDYKNAANLKKQFDFYKNYIGTYADESGYYTLKKTLSLFYDAEREQLYAKYSEGGVLFFYPNMSASNYDIKPSGTRWDITIFQDKRIMQTQDNKFTYFYTKEKE